MKWWEHDGKGLADAALNKAYQQPSGISEDIPFWKSQATHRRK